MEQKSNEERCKSFKKSRVNIFQGILWLLFFTALFSPVVYAQQGKIIVGKITDSSGIPLPSVSIVINANQELKIQ